MRINVIHEGVYRITTPFEEGRGTVMVYLIKGDSVVMVDTGVARSPEDVLRPALAELGLALSDVDLILNTHCHPDHAGGNLAIKQASGARIYFHAADTALATSTDAVVEHMTAPLRALDFPREMVEERGKFVRTNYGAPAGFDVALQHGDVVDLGAGFRLRVVHTPGHTAGSVSYLWEAEGVLFTGDGVLGHGSRLGAYPLYMDAVSYRQSLATLAQLDFRTLCLGHAYIGGTLVNEPVRIGADAVAFIKESIWVVDTIHSAVAEAVGRLPGASKSEVALAALSELIYHIPQKLVRKTGMPLAAAPALSGHIDAALAGTYPQ